MFLLQGDGLAIGGKSKKSSAGGAAALPKFGSGGGDHRIQRSKARHRFEEVLASETARGVASIRSGGIAAPAPHASGLASASPYAPTALMPGGPGRGGVSGMLPKLSVVVHTADSAGSDSNRRPAELSGPAWQYVRATAAPSAAPTKPYCDVCGFASKYSCPRCAARYCSTACRGHHLETRCIGSKPPG